MARAPRQRWRLCILEGVHPRLVSVQFRVLPTDDGDAAQVLEFRPFRSKRPVVVKLADIFRAKTGNVELSQALDGVEEAVDRVRDARQFHLYERTPDGWPKLDCEVVPFPVPVVGKVNA